MVGYNCVEWSAWQPGDHAAGWPTNPYGRSPTVGYPPGARPLPGDLGDQAEALVAVVAERGWVHVGHVADPGVSGKRLANRPGLLGVSTGSTAARLTFW